MRGRKSEPFVLKPKDKKALQQLMHDGHTPLGVARRAQILLSCAEAKPSVSAVSGKVDQNRSTVWRVCARYRAVGLEAALYDAPRPQGGHVFFPEGERQHIEDLACEAPACVGRELTHWSQRSLAQAAGELGYVESIHQTTVGDTLREADAAHTARSD